MQYQLFIYHDSDAARREPWAATLDARQLEHVYSCLPAELAVLLDDDSISTLGETCADGDGVKVTVRSDLTEAELHDRISAALRTVNQRRHGLCLCVRDNGEGI